jgi:DNA-binding transcriptional regulator YiaG
MLRKPPSSGKPSWAKAILSLRESLKLNQAEFGSRLGFSAMAVSRWERGAQEPPSAPASVQSSHRKESSWSPCPF